MVRLALKKATNPSFKGKKVLSFQPAICPSTYGVFGAKLIIRPSIMRAVRSHQFSVSSHMRERLSNLME